MADWLGWLAERPRWAPSSRPWAIERRVYGIGILLF